MQSSAIFGLKKTFQKNMFEIFETAQKKKKNK